MFITTYLIEYDYRAEDTCMHNMVKRLSRNDLLIKT